MELQKYKKRAIKPSPLEYPLPCVMVSCGTMEDSNIITIAWTGIINSEPPMTYISVRPERYSHDIIENSGEFVINLVNEELTNAMDYCGVKSGRDVDKYVKLGLTAMHSEVVSAPLIAESPVSIECKVVEIKKLGSHDMFIARIEAVHVAEEYIDGKGAYRFDKMKLVASNHGGYFKLNPERLGFFGYSIMKPKTAKRKGINKRLK